MPEKLKKLKSKGQSLQHLILNLQVNWNSPMINKLQCTTVLNLKNYHCLTFKLKGAVMILVHRSKNHTFEVSTKLRTYLWTNRD